MAINRTGNDGQVNRARETQDTTRTSRTELGGGMIGTGISNGGPQGLSSSFAPELSTALNNVTNGLVGGGGGGGSRALE